MEEDLRRVLESHRSNVEVLAEMTLDQEDSDGDDEGRGDADKGDVD